MNDKPLPAKNTDLQNPFAGEISQLRELAAQYVLLVLSTGMGTPTIRRQEKLLRERGWTCDTLKNFTYAQGIQALGPVK